jgi:hypothetical protein
VICQELLKFMLLSCADIEGLLAHFLPRRDVTEGEVIFQLQQRHLQRQKAIESHARRQKKSKQNHATSKTTKSN